MPTIVTSVPAARLSTSAVPSPNASLAVASMPQAVERILAETQVRLISMARPMLSDPTAKAQSNRRRNQHLHLLQSSLPDHDGCENGVVSAHPRAVGARRSYVVPTRRARSVAVVGASTSRWPRRPTPRNGVTNTLFEANDFIGDSLTWLRRIPGKEEFSEPSVFLDDSGQTRC